MIGGLKRYYKKQQFSPGIFAVFVNPFYLARKGLFENIKRIAYRITGRTLDVGCGQKPYQNLFRSSEYIGLELDTPTNRAGKRADLYYDGNRFPFQDAEFDSVVINEVLEHVFNPDIFLAEVNRVLKQSGTMLMTTPFCWDEHEQPYDYARYSSFGIRYLLEKNGFEVLELKKSGKGITAVFQMIGAYLYKITLSKSKIINMVSMMIMIAPLNIAGILLSLLLPEGADLYLDNVILARKRAL